MSSAKETLVLVHLYVSATSWRLHVIPASRMLSAWSRPAETSCCIVLNMI